MTLAAATCLLLVHPATKVGYLCKDAPAEDATCSGSAACDHSIGCYTYTYTPLCRSCQQKAGFNCSSNPYTSQRAQTLGYCKLGHPYGAQCYCYSKDNQPDEPKTAVNCDC